MMSQVYEGGVNDSTPTGMGKVTAIGQRADGIYLFQNETVIESYLQMLGVLNGWCGIIYKYLIDRSLEKENIGKQQCKRIYKDMITRAKRKISTPFPTSADRF